MTTLDAGQLILLAVLAFWLLLSLAAIRSWRTKPNLPPVHSRRTRRLPDHLLQAVLDNRAEENRRTLRYVAAVEAARREGR